MTGFFVRARTDVYGFLHATLPALIAVLLLHEVANRRTCGQEESPSDHRTDNASDVIRVAPLPGALEAPVITAMIVSPTETSLAAAGDDHAIRLISLTDRTEVAALRGHEDWVRGLSFSESGRYLASCADDGWVRVWDVTTRKLVVEANAGHSLYAVSFADDRTLFAVGFSSSVYRLDIKVGKLEIEHECDCRDLRSIEISPTKKQIAYAGRDGVLRIRDWDGQKSKTWSIAPLHSDRVRSIKFSEDGSTITSVGEDRRVVHYDIAKKTILSQTEVRGGKLLGLCPLDSERFAVAGSDNTIRILGWNSTVPELKLIGHDGSVSVLQRTDKYLISTGFDTTIRIWDLKRAFRERDRDGRYAHPVASQFEDSGLSKPGTLVKTPIQ